MNASKEPREPRHDARDMRRDYRQARTMKRRQAPLWASVPVNTRELRGVQS